MSVGGVFSELFFYLNYAVDGSEKLRANSKSVLSSSAGIQLNSSLPFFCCSKFRTASSQQSLSIKLYIVFHYFVLLFLLAWHSKKVRSLLSPLTSRFVHCQNDIFHSSTQLLSSAIINSIYFLLSYFNCRA